MYLSIGLMWYVRSCFTEILHIYFKTTFPFIFFLTAVVAKLKLCVCQEYYVLQKHDLTSFTMDRKGLVNFLC